MSTPAMSFAAGCGLSDLATRRDLDQLVILTMRDVDEARTLPKRDIDDVRHEIEAAEHRLRADMRAEINGVVTNQTRTLMFALIGPNVSVAALAFAAASLR